MNEKSDSTTDPIKRLEDISVNWFKMIEESTNGLNKKFDILCENIKQNESLLEEIEEKQQNKLKSIISKSNLNINGKTSQDLSETDLKNQFNCLESSKQSLSSELITKKHHKTELTNKTKALTKQLEQMEIKVKQLRQNSNQSNDSNEYLTLASVMRVMYKTWNNSKVIGRKELSFI